ncbi:MAG: XcyI family restriction endonuclease [Lewinellaceae bacterium]|nr:XcyI family restriction endonuclease [Saprospiraceae bacterium]MCB9338051.1 XcyI family restriction endonuclease [Lewinellaceae bacterium]
MPKVPKEVVQESYLLKATFFFRKLSELHYVGIDQRVKDIAAKHKNEIGWSSRGTLGINEGAWAEIIENGIEPIRIFAHPTILKIYPDLLKYYRCLALLSQKGFQTLAEISSIKNFEEKGKEIPEHKLPQIVKVINEFMSTILGINGWFKDEFVKAMVYSVAGVTIDGSWRNAIGEEGERIIKLVIIQGLRKNSEIDYFIMKNEQKVYADKTDGNFDESYVKTIFLKNRYTIVFKSEPDGTITSPDGDVVGGIEVKAGLDPAGALERLGAMLKSFDNIKQAYPKAQTILVASCITDEVQSRLQEAQTVNYTYMLTDITLKKREAEAKFVNKVREICGLIQKRL